MPLEDELGEALRRAGEGFTADRDALVDAGERRGRRLVARRRAAVVGGSVLALALVGAGSAWTGGLLGGGSGGSGQVDVAAPPQLVPEGSGGKVTAEQMLAVFQGLLPDGGRLAYTTAQGTDGPPMVSGVFDDGNGKGAVMLGLSRVDPDGSHARELTECGDKELQGYDDCRTEQLVDGSKLLLYKGYEYPDRRVDTKVWRAVLVTPQGFQVDASAWNAPAEKGAGISRTDPPLTIEQLSTLVTSQQWYPALKALPAAEQEPTAVPESQAALRDRKAVESLESLMAGLGIKTPVVSKGGEDGVGYVVLDDGKGKSLVVLRVSKAQSTHGFTGPDLTTQPDGTTVQVTQGPVETGKGVVVWTVDTLRKDGLRVLVSAYNTGEQHGKASRETPALTLEQLKKLALAPGWNRTLH